MKKEIEECFYDLSDNCINKVEISLGKIIDDCSLIHNTLEEKIGRDFRVKVVTGNYDPHLEPNKSNLLFPAIEESVSKAKGYIGQLNQCNFTINVTVKIDFVEDIQE